MAHFDDKMPHSQCEDCNVIYDSVFAGQNPDKQVNIITDEGEMIASSAPEDAVRANVSHGICKDCFPKRMEQMRADIAARKRAKAAADNIDTNG